MKKETLLDLGLLWLRVIAGAGIAYHGYGKVFGGGVEGLTQGVAALGFPIPGAFAWAAALSEFVGGVCLVLGLWTRWAALFIFTTMSVAAFGAHAKDPLNVKELALAYWTIAGALFFAGAGTFSLDSRFKK